MLSDLDFNYKFTSHKKCGNFDHLTTIYILYMYYTIMQYAFKLTFILIFFVIPNLTVFMTTPEKFKKYNFSKKKKFLKSHR